MSWGSFFDGLKISLHTCVQPEILKSHAISKLETTQTSSGHQKPIRNFYVLGQNVASESVSDIADLLLNRDLNEVYNFDGNNEESIGTIFIPEGFLPKKPRIVNPDIAQEIQRQFPSDKKLCGEVKQTVSDLIEKEVYKVLESFFKGRKSEAILVIQGIQSYQVQLKSFQILSDT